MIYGVQGQNSRIQLQVPKVAIAVWLHIRCRLQAMATLGMMYHCTLLEGVWFLSDGGVI